MPLPSAPAEIEFNAVAQKFTQTEPFFEDTPVVIKQAKITSRSPSAKIQEQLFRPKHRSTRWKLWLTTFITCFIYASPTGFHYVVLNNSKRVVEQFVIDNIPFEYRTDFRVSVIWSALNACMSIGCVIGSFASAYFADRFGRKFTLMFLANVLSMIGNVFLFLAKPTKYVSFLAVGRGVCGFAAGFAQPILGVYLMESCPPHLAGFVGSFVDTFLAIMLTVTHLLATPDVLGNEDMWPLLLSGCFWLAILGLLVYPVFPETPKYLITTKNEVMKGAKAIRFFHDLRRDEMAEALRVAQEINKSEQQVSKKPIGWLRAWIDYPRPMAISTVVGISAVLCGHIALQSYSTQILVISGMWLKTAQIETIVMGSFETAGGLMAPIINHYGTRRFVMLTTLMVCVVMNLCIFGLFFAGSFINDVRLSFAAAGAAMVLVFAAITGPFALRPVIAAEVSPQVVRAKAVTLTMGASQSTAIMVQWMSWPFFKMYGSYLFLCFAALTFATWLYTYIALPDNPRKVANPTVEKERRGDVKYRRLLNEASETEESGSDSLDELL